MTAITGGAVSIRSYERVAKEREALKEQLAEVEDCLHMTHKALCEMARRGGYQQPPELPERYTVSRRKA